MRQITVSVTRTRTTTDDCGHQYHVVSGRGATPFDALADLKGAALTAAKEIAERFPPGLPESPDAYWHADTLDENGDPEWQFEVVGVQIAAGPLDSGEPGWLALGTLASRHNSPEDLGWWDAKPPPSLRDRAARRLGH